jgi:hypothetical protein
VVSHSVVEPDGLSALCAGDACVGMHCQENAENCKRFRCFSETTSDRVTSDRSHLTASKLKLSALRRRKHVRQRVVSRTHADL